MHRSIHPLLALSVTAVLAAAPVAAGDLIFADDFETGGFSAWSSVHGLADCLAGQAPADALAGDLGPAPPGSLVACLEMRNDRAVERSEIAYSSLPLPRGLGLTDTADLVLVAPGERRIAAQFDIVSRWAAPLSDTSAPIRWLQVSTPSGSRPTTPRATSSATRPEIVQLPIRSPSRWWRTARK
ncbi:MAG: hypothetical protein AAGC60_26580 [Acidobacteriota bacterium]